MTLQDKLDAIQARAESSVCEATITRLIKALRECMSHRDKLINIECDEYNAEEYAHDCDYALLAILEAE